MLGVAWRFGGAGRSRGVSAVVGVVVGLNDGVGERNQYP